MRKRLLFLFLALPTLAFSLDTQLKGFIALDAFNFKKIQRQQNSVGIGIGVLDLKVFAEQENMLAAIKLNVDGDLEVKNNLFEEAYATYRGIPDFKITLGKGVVRFQNLHWGVIANSYQDGGSVIKSENSWRKISNKALFSVAYGNKTIGFSNNFTIWGDSQEIQYDSSGAAKFNDSPGTGTKYVTEYSTAPTPSFSTRKQLGLANKFEYYKIDNFTFTTGQAYYKNKLQDKASYALDFGVNFENEKWNTWTDVLYGFTSKAPFEAYSTFRKYEYFIQTGAQYFLDEKWSVLTNFEYLYVKDRAHTYSNFVLNGITYAADSKIDKKGQLAETSMYKIELGTQYKLSKTSFITSGVLHERKNVKLNGVKDLNSVKGVYNPNAEAYQFLTSVSFWF